MSRKHGHRRHRRRRHPAPLCPRCLTPADASPAAVLSALAAALNAAEAVLRLRIRHGVLWSGYGVILPPGKREPWSARPFREDPLSPEPGPADDGMDG